jgi:hypothetical protein
VLCASLPGVTVGHCTRTGIDIGIDIGIDMGTGTESASDRHRFGMRIRAGAALDPA